MLTSSRLYAAVVRERNDASVGVVDNSGGHDLEVTLTQDCLEPDRRGALIAQRLILVQSEADDDVVAGKFDGIHPSRRNPRHVDRVGVGQATGIGKLSRVCRRANVVPELRNAERGGKSDHQDYDPEAAQGEGSSAAALSTIALEQEEHDADKDVDQLDQKHHEHTGECVAPKILASTSPAFSVKLHRYRLMKLP